MIALRKYTGKKLVSFLRQGDFAHAGETNAIDMVMKRFPKDRSQLILDAGCGLGGTANYIANQNWGKVFGFDIESSAIEYAKTKYPDVSFFVSDVVDANKAIQDTKFEIICLFNSFYAFPYQEQALSSLSKVAKNGASLALFDYCDFCGDDEVNPLFRPEDENHCPFIPVKLSNIKNMLFNSGWLLEDLIDVSAEYEKWYTELLSSLETKKDEIRNTYGETGFEKAYSTYSTILQATIDKVIGGVIVYAKKMKPSLN